MTLEIGTKLTAQRINFIEREPLRLTYRKMLIYGSALFGFLILVGGLQVVRFVSTQKNLDQLTREVTQLKTERERQLKKSMASTEALQSGRSVLLQIFQDASPWSSILKELTYQAPRSLWLTSLKSYERNSPEVERGLLLQGTANEVETATQFAKSLTQSIYFKRVQLTSLKRVESPGEAGYEFEIALVMPPPRITAPVSQPPKKPGGKAS